jgi:hypothetical protein
MRARTLAIFAVATALAIGGAIVVSQLRAPQQSIEKSLLFPDLKSRINDIVEVRIHGKDRQVTLLRKDNAWSIREADGYPALFDRIKTLAVGASELRVLSEKTSNPRLFKRLDVEDTTEQGSNSVQVAFADGAGKPIAELIVGKSKRRGGPGSKPSLYVRRPGTERALLVEGELDVSVELGAWMNRDLFDIPADRVREVSIRAADGTGATLSRKLPADPMTLANVPRGKEPQSEIMLDRMATALESVFIDGARAADQLSLPETSSFVTVRTFDGLVAEIHSAKVDGKNYSRFAFSFDQQAADAHRAELDAARQQDAAPKEKTVDESLAEAIAEKPDAATSPDDDAPDAATPEGDAAQETPPDVAAEVEKLNQAVAGWVFQIPEFKFELFTENPAELVRDPVKDAAPAPLPPLPGTP